MNMNSVLEHIGTSRDRVVKCTVFLEDIADYAEIDEVCCVAVARVDGLVSQASLPTGVPVFGSDSAVASLGGTIFTDFPYPPGIFPPEANFSR